VHLLKSNGVVKLSFSFSFAIRFAFANLSSLRAKNWLSSKIIILLVYRPSKTDSAPIRGNGYEPGSLKFRPRANAETSHSVRYDFVVVVVSVRAVVKSF